MIHQASRPHEWASSDPRHDSDPQTAGMQLVQAMRSSGFDQPVVAYVGQIDRTRGTPPGLSGLTDRPDELVHLLIDVLERIRGRTD